MTQTSQLSRGTHRVREHLAQAGRMYPDAWKSADRYRSGRGTDYPDWPDWCYLPIGAAAGIVAADAKIPIEQLPLRYPARIADAARLAALASWRMTQSVYRFDPALYAALIATPVSGDLPEDVLHHLPEWCVYVETPGQSFGGGQLHGFWAHLEHDLSGRTELRLILDGDPETAPLMPFGIHVSGGLAQGLAEFVAEAQRQAKATGVTFNISTDAQNTMRSEFEPLVSLLLYLCTEAADLSRRGNYTERPANPSPVRTRRLGTRLFPPSGPREWDVGVRIGTALREAYQREQPGAKGAPTGRYVRPHIRRAHWHTFLSDPRDNPAQQQRILRWLPPIPINVTAIDALPTTVRPVRH